MEVPSPARSPPGPSGTWENRSALLSVGEGIRTAVLEAAGPGPVSLLFSGGLDSSLLALLLAAAGIPVELLVVGLPGSPDLPSASEGATALGLPLSSAVLAPSEVLKCAIELQDLPGAPDGTALAVQTAFALALQRAREGRVLCGQGADELFLGYSHYQTLTGRALEGRAEQDLLRLRQVDFPFTCSVASRWGKSLAAPYLSRDVIDVLAPVPWEARRGPGEPKALLRRVALSLGLPPSLAGKRKKALQYGSGVERTLRKGLPPRPKRTQGGPAPPPPGTER